MCCVRKCFRPYFRSSPHIPFVLHYCNKIFFLFCSSVKRTVRRGSGFSPSSTKGCWTGFSKQHCTHQVEDWVGIARQSFPVHHSIKGRNTIFMSINSLQFFFVNLEEYFKDNRFKLKKLYSTTKGVVTGIQFLQTLYLFIIFL